MADDCRSQSHGWEKNKTLGGSHQWNSGCWHRLGIRCRGYDG